MPNQKVRAALPWTSGDAEADRSRSRSDQIRSGSWTGAASSRVSDEVLHQTEADGPAAKASRSERRPSEKRARHAFLPEGR